jgi:hypothetical protein
MSFTEDFKTGVSPYRQKVDDVLHFLFQYLKNPIQAVRQLPDWDWPTLHIFLAACAAIGGFLSGLVAVKFSQVLGGLIVFPITVTVMSWLLTGFFYYSFFFLFQRELQLKALFTLIALSLLPFFAIYIISPILDPLKIIGLSVSAILLGVGLSEMTGIDRKKIFKLIGALYLVYLLFWVFNTINFKKKIQREKNLTIPGSFEKLEEEMSQ